MKKDFDHIAKKYDTDFTFSEIGKRQRNSVYRYLNAFFKKNKTKKSNILELNCGTGEDAIWFTKQGHQVLATDISDKMIQVAKEKAKDIENLKFRQLDIKEVDTRLLDARHKDDESSIKKCDLIFSNFGGLNCLNPEDMELFFRNSSQLVDKNGKLILVIMPKNTLWESLYFILKRKFKTAFRRNTTIGIDVNVENKKVKTWYYNPTDIKALAMPYFTIINTKPIGFFIPPSYLEPYFKRHKRLLRILDRLEKQIGNLGFLSRFSDHYLIELEYKN